MNFIKGELFSEENNSLSFFLSFNRLIAKSRYSLFDSIPINLRLRILHTIPVVQDPANGSNTKSPILFYYNNTLFIQTLNFFI